MAASNSPTPGIPVSFRRAARRAVFLTWFVRIAGALAALLLIGAVVGLILLPGVARHKARQRLLAAGVSGSLEITRLNHRELILRDISFGEQQGDLAVAELRASFSLPQLRQGRIEKIHLTGMSGVAGMEGARWTFAGLEKLAALARAEGSADPAAAGAFTVRQVTISDSFVTLKIPGLPDMTVPFELSAGSEDGALYQFTATLAPGSAPLAISGELNPFGGSARIMARGNAMEIANWAQYLLSGSAGHGGIARLEAKTDIQLSTIFDDFTLVWAHFDAELAGLKATIKGVSPRPGDHAADAAPETETTAHSASISVDVIPGDTAEARPRVESSLRLRQGRATSRQGAAFAFDELHATGHVTRDAQARSRFRADCRLAGTSLDIPGRGRLEADSLAVDIPECLSRDTARWELSSPLVRLALGDIRGLSREFNAVGNLDEARLNLADISLSRGDIAAAGALMIQLSRAGASPLLAEGTVKKLRRGTADLLAGESAFSLRQTRKDTLQVSVPQLTSPLAPGASLEKSIADITMAADGGIRISLTSQAVLPVNSLATRCGVAMTPEPQTVRGTLTGSATLDGAATVAKLGLNLPAQAVAITTPQWRATGNFAARITAQSGPQETVSITAKCTDFSLHHGKNLLKCRQIALADIAVAGTSPGEIWQLLSGARAPGAERLVATGSVAADGIDAAVAMTRLKNGALALPFNWHGAHGFLPPKQDSQAPIRISAESMQVGDIVFIPVKTTASLEHRELKLSVDVTDSAKALAGTVAGSFTFGANAPALLRAEIKCPDLAALSWLPGLSPLPSLRTANLRGAVSLSASLFADAVSMAGTGELLLDQVGISAPDNGFVVEGISSRIRFGEVFPPATDPGQKLVFERARIGNFITQGGGLGFQIPRKGGLFIEQAILKWCDGLLKTHAVMLEPGSNHMRLDIYAENLALGKVLNAQSLLRGNALGTFDGRLPLTVAGGKITHAGISLFSSPGNGGRLALQNPAEFLAMLGIPAPYDKELLATLADMKYSSWRLGVTDGDKSLLSLQLDGYSADKRKATPVRLSRSREMPSADILQMLRILADSAKSVRPPE